MIATRAPDDLRICPGEEVESGSGWMARPTIEIGVLHYQDSAGADRLPHTAKHLYRMCAGRNERRRHRKQHGRANVGDPWPGIGRWPNLALRRPYVPERALRRPYRFRSPGLEQPRLRSQE